MESTSFVIAELLYKKQTALIFSSALYGAILLDFILCLPAEFKYIYFRDFKALFTKGKIPPIPSFLLFTGRALTIPLLTTAYIAFVGKTSDCNVLWRAVLMLYAAAAINAIAIFVVRVIAIRKSGVALTFCLFFLLSCHALATIYWLLNAKANTSPLGNEPFQPSCQGVALPIWTYRLLIGFGCMDLILLFLTLYESNDFKTACQRYKMTWKTLKSQETTVTQRFYCDSVLLFAVQISFIFMEVGWLRTHSGDEIYSLLPAPLHCFLSLSLAPKAIRSLKLFHAKNNSKKSGSQDPTRSQRFNDVAGRFDIQIERTKEGVVQGPHGTITNSIFLREGTDDTAIYIGTDGSTSTFEIMTFEKESGRSSEGCFDKDLPPLPSTMDSNQYSIQQYPICDNDSQCEMPLPMKA